MHAQKRYHLSHLDEILHDGKDPHVIMSAHYGDNWLRDMHVGGGLSDLPFPIDFDCSPYNTQPLLFKCVIYLFAYG